MGGRPIVAAGGPVDIGGLTCIGEEPTGNVETMDTGGPIVLVCGGPGCASGLIGG